MVNDENKHQKNADLVQMEKDIRSHTKKDH